MPAAVTSSSHQWVLLGLARVLLLLGCRRWRHSLPEIQLFKGAAVNYSLPIEGLFPDCSWVWFESDYLTLTCSWPLIVHWLYRPLPVPDHSLRSWCCTVILCVLTPACPWLLLVCCMYRSLPASEHSLGSWLYCIIVWFDPSLFPNYAPGSLLCTALLNWYQSWSDLRLCSLFPVLPVIH